MPRDEKNGGRRTSQEDSGLSFEAEPTGLGRENTREERDNDDPGRSSPRADFTPGREADVRSPAARSPVSTILIAVAVVVLIIVAAMWLF